MRKEHDTAIRRTGDTAREQKRNIFFRFDRLFVFVVSTIALANFFESGRLIATEQTFTHISTSVISFLIFIISLLIMGYWVYVEEKEKSNLKYKFGLYEWLYKKRYGEPAIRRNGEKR